MKGIVKWLLAFFIRSSLWFRYKVTVKGLETLTPHNLKKTGGVLLLPNHPAVFVDPALITLAVWNKFPIRPMIVEYMFYNPAVNKIMRYIDALPMPDFASSSNSLKKKRSERVIQTVIDSLKKGDNFLIYPSGRTKQTGYESIGGASAVQYILSHAKEANVVLVRIKGMWGSSFSRAYTGKAPPMFPTIWQGIKHAFKNLLFFTPRRHIIIELQPAPVDFPYEGSRLEINRYLEAYYNKPDGLTVQEGKYPGDSLIRVSYSMWKNVVYELPSEKKIIEKEINLEAIPDAVKQKVYSRLAQIAEVSPEIIKPNMNLATDIGMDSLNIAEVAIFLQDEFDIQNIPIQELTTVARVLGIADKQIVFDSETEEETINISKWQKKPSQPKHRIFLPPGKTLPEVFLNNCERMDGDIACADDRSGILTYPQLKIRVILLARFIRKLEGEHIGILLPSSVAATTLILATQLAGKVPLLVNWTVGARHLESVVNLSNVKHILTSWAFIDRLENVDLDPIEDKLMMLEEQRHSFTLTEKIKSFLLSKKSTASILKKFGIDKSSENDKAVLLFTSGTESLPKGVPLSHKNIISTQKAALDGLLIYSDDIFLSILPPFHSFGFSITTLIPPMSGLRGIYSPDPTSGKKLASTVQKWGATIMCGTPAFIKGIMKFSTKEQLKTVRICFTGAEKAPAELFQLMTTFFGSDKFLLEGYGITECAPILTFNREDRAHKGVGLPAAGVELCIVHPETYAPISQGNQGLILAKGPNIFAGYLNPSLSSPFVELEGASWYKTGDLGFLDEQGFLTISGRLKRFIKVGAEMISLAAIEDALLKTGLAQGWPISQDTQALAVCSKEISGERPKIYLFTTFNLSLDEANIAIKKSGFSNIVRISSVMRILEIPLMGSGKTNYRFLESEYLPKMEQS